MSPFRKLLLAIFMLAATSSAFGAGSFASFTATTTNQAATFATGTLVLSNKVGTAGACFSGGASSGTISDTNSNNCDVLVNVSGLKPGTAQDQTIDLTLKNEGSLAGDLTLFWNGSDCASAAATSVNGFTGSGNLCGAVQMLVEEHTSALRDDATPTCLYGGTDCAYDSAKTLLDFSQKHKEAVSSPSVGPLSWSAVAGSGEKHLRIKLRIPSTGLVNPNQYQGRSISNFSLTAKLVQT